MLRDLPLIHGHERLQRGRRDLGQGFLLARPLALDAIDELLESSAGVGAPVGAASVPPG